MAQSKKVPSDPAPPTTSGLASGPAAAAATADGKRKSKIATVKWADSKARAILISDMEEGILPIHAADLGPREAWDLLYSLLSAFEGMEYEKF